MNAYARALTLVFALSALANVRAGASEPSAAERAYARGVAPASANEVTGNLLRNIGKRVAFICTVTAIVHPDTMIGQCGREAEPVDMYVLTPTAGYRIGTKLRVLGEMLPPGQWVDVTGHSWFTPFVKAKFVDRF